MIKTLFKNPPAWLLLVSAVSLGGCSSVPFFSDSGSKPDRAASLAVPPAFTAPNSKDELAMPAVASARATAMAEKNKQGGVLAAGTDVKVSGGPNSRYLVVDAAPDAVWPKLQSFLQDEGYDIKKIQPAAGMIETSWTGEQSADQNGFSIMRLLKIAKDTLFKPDNLKKVRVRIEKGESDQQTLVFVTSHKMPLEGDKPLVPGDENTSFKYADAKPDPALSAATMARLAAYLSGKSEAQSRAMMTAAFSPRSKVIYKKEDDVRYVKVDQSYPQVWNRTGLALDRLGFDPIKSDRKAGTIEVKHAHPQALYQDVAIRGVKIDPKKDMVMHLTLKVVPQRDGSTRINVDSIKVDGGTLPHDRLVVLNKLSAQLQ